jgi:hypothetical protein
VLPVRDRRTGKIRKLKLEGLTGEIEEMIKDKPVKPLPMPKELSKRPQFYG